MGGGKGGGSYSEPSSSVTASKIANQMYNQTGGIRNSVFNELQQFMGGGSEYNNGYGGGYPMYQAQPKPIANTASYESKASNLYDPVAESAQYSGDTRGSALAEVMAGFGLAPKQYSPDYSQGGGYGGDSYGGGEGDSWDWGSSPMWAPGKMAIEDQYRVAKDNILANMPSGGALYESLGDLERGRAGGYTDLTGQIGMDMWNKAYSVATGVPQTSLQGLGVASQGQSQAMMANANADAGKAGMMGDLGMGAGMLLK